MKKIIIALVFLSMVGWTIYEFAFTSDEVEQDTPEVSLDETSDENGLDTSTEAKTIGLEIGNLAPDFALTTLSGEEVALSDYRGRTVMLNFWATWCPPCRAEMPDMQKFYQDTEVEVLAVNLTETERTIDDVHQFVDEYQLTFPILLDEAIDIAMIYAIQPIPTSFMIDPEGIIQFKIFGPMTYEQMVQVLDDIN